MLSTSRRFSARALLAVAACAVGASAQSTWHVDAANPNVPGTGSAADPYTSLQYAVDQPTTASLDTLLVRPGTYLGGLIVPATKALAIRSTDGPLATTLRGSVPGTRIRVNTSGDDPATVIDGFTITAFSASQNPPVHAVNAIFRRCILTGNLAPGFDTFLFVEYSVELAQCTITGNLGAVGNQGVGGGSIVMNDTICRGNGAFDLWNPGGATSGAHNVIGSILFRFTAPGHIDVDPAFWSVPYGDLHLRPGSPCIDAGNPAAPLDPDGTPRDIGALPFDQAYAPTPAIYCEGKLNSSGCVPSIDAQGLASATNPAPFLITCSEVVNGRRGLLFYGFEADALPFQGGLYCIVQPTRRTVGQISGGIVGVPCTGSYAFDFNTRIQLGGDPLLTPGRMVFAQYWYVDPADPAGFGTGLSDAVRFGIGP